MHVKTFASKHTNKKFKDSFARILPSHVTAAFQKWALVTKTNWNMPRGMPIIHRIRRIPPSLKCVSHYVNPKGMGITNTISCAELAAIAAAVVHGYSHIATDNLTSLHQIKKQLSHPNLHRHHIQGDVLQSNAKAIRQSPSPIHFFKVSPMPVLSVMSMPTFLLKSQPPPTPTLQTPPSKQQAPRKIPSTTSTAYKRRHRKQKTKHKPIIIPIQQTWPILLPQSFGTYQTTLTSFKHICIFSINWEMPKLKRTTMRTTRPSSRTALPMDPLAMLT